MKRTSQVIWKRLKKCTPLIFTRNLLMETLFTEIHFLSCKKMLGDGQVTMRYEVSPSMTVGTNNKVQMAHLLV